MNTNIATIDTVMIALTACSGSTTVSCAPIAEVTTMIADRITDSRVTTRPARANRTVADKVMNVTANMLVATATRGDSPHTIITGTLTSELPPVITPTID